MNIIEHLIEIIAEAEGTVSFKKLQGVDPEIGISHSCLVTTPLGVYCGNGYDSESALKEALISTLRGEEFDLSMDGDEDCPKEYDEDTCPCGVPLSECSLNQEPITFSEIIFGDNLSDD